VTDRGSATVELVLIAPVLVLLMLFAVAAGRFSVARNQINEAARDAAREASTWRTPQAASTNGVERGLASLADSHMSCHAPSVQIDASDLRPGGEVVADVTCTVELGDLLGLRLGGEKTFQARSVAVVDAFRSSG
jgi:Flp pilus assembly protein TadG